MRIVFAFSKIAATLKSVLGPVWMLGRDATAGFRLTDCIDKTGSKTSKSQILLTRLDIAFGV